MTMSNNNVSQFGDTSLTKVFVGGLAWETQKDTMKDHFEKYGDILEAVIISDKLTGRSKGYGFVTFKEAESAKKACEDATPIINGRRANCNLASLGARRPRSASNMGPPLPHLPPQQQQQQQVVPNGGPRSASPVPAASHVQWYYPAAATPPPPPSYHHQAVPFYGYSPAYIATNVGYNHKLSYTGGSYMNGGQYSQVYPGQHMVGGNTTLMPMYHPYYHFHQSQAMGLPAHIYPTAPGPIPAASALISKPTTITPNSDTIGRGRSTSEATLKERVVQYWLGSEQQYYLRSVTS